MASEVKSQMPISEIVQLANAIGVELDANQIRSIQFEFSIEKAASCVVEYVGKCDAQKQSIQIPERPDLSARSPQMVLLRHTDASGS